MATVARPVAEMSDITSTVRRSPILVMTSPDSGIAMVEPIAMLSRMSPSTPGDTRSWLRTCGIRAAQLANANPAAMKTT